MPGRSSWSLQPCRTWSMPLPSWPDAAADGTAIRGQSSAGMQQCGRAACPASGAAGTELFRPHPEGAGAVRAFALRRGMHWDRQGRSERDGVPDISDMPGKLCNLRFIRRRQSVPSGILHGVAVGFVNARHAIDMASIRRRLPSLRIRPAALLRRPLRHCSGLARTGAAEQSELMTMSEAHASGAAPASSSVSTIRGCAGLQL